MKKILLDTSAYTHFAAGNRNLLNELNSAETVFISIFVLGELFAGFNGGGKRDENINILNKFLNKSKVQFINTTIDTAEIFGTLKYQLKSKGNLIPINDVWIAAHAMEHGAALLSFDQHFKLVPGLILKFQQI